MGAWWRAGEPLLLLCSRCSRDWYFVVALRSPETKHRSSASSRSSPWVRSVSISSPLSLAANEAFYRRGVFGVNWGRLCARIGAAREYLARSRGACRAEANRLVPRFFHRPPSFRIPPSLTLDPLLSNHDTIRTGLRRSRDRETAAEDGRHRLCRGGNVNGGGDVAVVDSGRVSLVDGGGPGRPRPPQGRRAPKVRHLTIVLMHRSPGERAIGGLVGAER